MFKAISNPSIWGIIAEESCLRGFNEAPIMEILIQ